MSTVTIKGQTLSYISNNDEKNKGSFNEVFHFEKGETYTVNGNKYNLDDYVLRKLNLDWKTDNKKATEECKAIEAQKKLAETCENVSPILDFELQQNECLSIIKKFDFDLMDLIFELPIPTKQEMMTIFGDLLTGIKCIHDNKYIHLDIKEQNIGLNYDDANKQKYVPVYIDFGFAQEINDNGYSINNHGYQGTLGYMDPVVFPEPDREKYKANTQSDLFALGFILKNIIYYYNHKQKNSYYTDNPEKIYNWNDEVTLFLKDYKGTKPSTEKFLSFIEKLSSTTKSIRFKNAHDCKETFDALWREETPEKKETETPEKKETETPEKKETETSPNKSFLGSFLSLFWTSRKPSNGLQF